MRKAQTIFRTILAVIIGVSLSVGVTLYATREKITYQRVVCLTNEYHYNGYISDIRIAEIKIKSDHYLVKNEGGMYYRLPKNICTLIGTK